jgi:hypothetical protein
MVEIRENVLPVHPAWTRNVAMASVAKRWIQQYWRCNNGKVER